MLTLLGSLAGIAMTLVALGALVSAMLRFSATNERFDARYFVGILLFFGVGLGIAAFMSLISPMAHDFIVIGICLGVAVTWALLYAGFGKKTLILGLIAIIAIYGYSGYSALLLATGQSPLARVPQTTSNSAPQVEAPQPVFQDNGGSTTSSLERKEPEEAPRESPSLKPTPQVRQSLPAPARIETTTAPSPKPSLRPRSESRPQRRTAVSRPSPEPPALPVEIPHQEPRRVASPPAASRRQEEPTASPSTARNSEAPPVVQSPPPSPTAVSVPEGCYGLTTEGSLNCLLESQQ